jgi:hypothetical protein
MRVFQIIGVESSSAEVKGAKRFLLGEVYRQERQLMVSSTVEAIKQDLVKYLRDGANAGIFGIPDTVQARDPAGDLVRAWVHAPVDPLADQFFEAVRETMIFDPPRLGAYQVRGMACRIVDR